MKRSKHNLSFTHLTSFNTGLLVPVGLVEVLPGDSIQMSSAILLRASPLVAPVMHPVDVRLHHWFVPNRLVWVDWEAFITGGPDGEDASVFPTVSLTTGLGAIGGLADYFGIPPLVTGTLDVSALPFRAYNQIWNEYYRDQDLQSEATERRTAGPDALTDLDLQRICWEKDYFTIARPWEQKGPSVTIPLVDRDVMFKEEGATPGFRTLQRSTATAVTATVRVNEAGTALAPIVAEVQGGGAITIRALREGLAIQRFEEARARYGSRYHEYLAHLGVRSSDARLARPEYLGGGRQRIQFSEVLSTSDAGSAVVGTMAGHGIAAMRSNGFRRFFEEHGYIMSLISVRPKSIYMDGLNRTWNRRTKTDFWQRELEHIGQQEVLNKEIYARHATPDGVFGYNDRYSSYRSTPSIVSGEFRDTLDFWHMARSFASAPALNGTFVSCVPTDRVFADTVADELQCQIRHSIQARRLVSSTANAYAF